MHITTYQSDEAPRINVRRTYGRPRLGGIYLGMGATDAFITDDEARKIRDGIDAIIGTATGTTTVHLDADPSDRATIAALLEQAADAVRSGADHDTLVNAEGTHVGEVTVR